MSFGLCPLSDPHLHQVKCTFLLHLSDLPLLSSACFTSCPPSSCLSDASCSHLFFIYSSASPHISSPFFAFHWLSNSQCQSPPAVEPSRLDSFHSPLLMFHIEFGFSLFTSVFSPFYSLSSYNCYFLMMIKYQMRMMSEYDHMTVELHDDFQLVM